MHVLFKASSGILQYGIPYASLLRIMQQVAARSAKVCLCEIGSACSAVITARVAVI